MARRPRKKSSTRKKVKSVGKSSIDSTDEVDETDEVELDTDAMLDPKQKAAVSREIRRKLEERDEARRFRADLDYLEEDLDDR